MRSLPIGEGFFRIWRVMDEMMTKSAMAKVRQVPNLRSKIREHSRSLSAKLQEHQTNIFPPHARKGIRPFTPSEAAKLLGVAEGGWCNRMAVFRMFLSLL